MAARAFLVAVVRAVVSILGGSVCKARAMAWLLEHFWWQCL